MKVKQQTLGREMEKLLSIIQIRIRSLHLLEEVERQ